MHNVGDSLNVLLPTVFKVNIPISCSIFLDGDLIVH
jgi:hypothetical protein